MSNCWYLGPWPLLVNIVYECPFGWNSLNLWSYIIPLKKCDDIGEFWESLLLYSEKGTINSPLSNKRNGAKEWRYMPKEESQSKNINFVETNNSSHQFIIGTYLTYVFRYMYSCTNKKGAHSRWICFVKSFFINRSSIFV